MKIPSVLSYQRSLIHRIVKQSDWTISKQEPEKLILTLIFRTKKYFEHNRTWNFQQSACLCVGVTSKMKKKKTKQKRKDKKKCVNQLDLQLAFNLALELTFYCVVRKTLQKKKR